MSANQDAEAGGSSASKRIKLSEPDLAVVCRCSGDDKEETIHYHSVAMALHSSYFDNLLTSGMQEAESKTVTLDDVDPKEFRLAIEILENPSKVLSTTAEEVMSVAPLYNRFEFSKGLKLTERILSNFLKEWTKQKKKAPTLPQFKIIGDAILFSQEANLENLIEKSKAFIKTKLRRVDMFGMGLFQESFIEKIQPFLEEYMHDCLEEFYEDHFSWEPDDLNEYFTREDFFETFYWELQIILNKKHMNDLKVKFKGSFSCEESSYEENISLPTIGDYTTHEMSDGTRMQCGIFRLLDSLADKVGVHSKSEIGDWCVLIRMGGGINYWFVHPFSKTLSLPPVGKGWTLALEEGPRGAEEGSVDATFELRVAKTSG